MRIVKLESKQIPKILLIKTTAKLLMDIQFITDENFPNVRRKFNLAVFLFNYLHRLYFVIYKDNFSDLWSLSGGTQKLSPKRFPIQDQALGSPRVFPSEAPII
ncbi:hypothetical protein RIR_jg24914.t1 [Rhizophagus irregularis DAOM 181602=DAOM 197198]|uniref:Uncharacterized protein n=1 Tax=Rhizophagus irregularis (strain DAOM 181602 / DAOM 197198 / MUCL 43194) TaxID=747089 RepID=U9UAL6_RHIID|nr:hypothetical protein RIR_jg24914.t1 [Rhizophagus irregularis DAOM 181602=DAOM 197198]CAG8674967.1 1006_t:CDS:1 [Rhizophagus irregularis]